MKKIQKGVAALLLLTMLCGLAACGAAAAAQAVPDKLSSTSEVASSDAGQTYVEQHELPQKQVLILSIKVDTLSTRDRYAMRPYDFAGKTVCA